MRIFRHAIFICAFLFLCLGVPFLYFHSKGALGTGVDAVSSASLVVPDQPSGTFYVLVNKERHAGTLTDWEKFFTEQDVGVIMEDLSCLIVKGDSAGKELADRYLARLAENQMKITEEDGTLIISKAEAGLYDGIIVSKEFADSLNFESMRNDPDTLFITISEAS